MRDYSFGNYISTLRERMGLSQYQLGVLVGVSDKAISKWENGASKPRINTIRKLSQIFDVSVDELLTCEYATFDRERKDLFTMKKDIVKLAESKMKDMYGEKPPVSVLNRFKMEQVMLSDSDELLWMGFNGLLQEKMKEKNYYFETRGPQIEASFIAWLLGSTDINPLPAHYYCPHCKKIEMYIDVRCGLDLPERKCTCGNKYKRDGYGIDAMNMYPLSKWNEIHIPKEAEKLVIDFLGEYFKGTGILQKLEVEKSDNEAADSINVIRVMRYMIMPYGAQNKNEINKKIDSVNEMCRIFREQTGITIVINSDECLENIREINADFSQEQLNEFFQYAIKNHTLEIPNTKLDLTAIYKKTTTPKYSDLIYILGITHGTGTWIDNAEILYNEGKMLDELITNREDVYTYLYMKLNGKCCDNPSGQVYEIKEELCKGKYSNGRMPEEVERLLAECDIPEWYIDSMKKIKYLFPKTNLIALLKKKIIMYSREKEKSNVLSD